MNIHGSEIAGGGKTGANLEQVPSWCRSALCILLAQLLIVQPAVFWHAPVAAFEIVDVAGGWENGFDSGDSWGEDFDGLAENDESNEPETDEAEESNTQNEDDDDEEETTNEPEPSCGAGGDSSQGGSSGGGSKTSFKVGKAFDLSSADKVQVQTDYMGRGLGALGVSRTYHSNANARPAWVTIPNGAGWRNGYDRRVELVNSTLMRLHRASGEILTYNFNGYSWIGTEPNGVLTALSGGAWQFVSQRNVVETYGANGRLYTMSQSGQPVSLQYDGLGRLASVSNEAARSLVFAYDASNRVSSITVPGGGQLNYTYDGNGNLIYLRFPDNTMRWYLYENPNFVNALTGILDETGRRVATWGYDSAGRPNYKSVGAGINPLSVTYGTQSATTTDARGTVRTRSFAPVNGKLKVTALTVGATATSGALTKTFTYDGFGNLASSSAPSGAVALAQKDSRGRPQTLTNAYGTNYAKTTQHIWHNKFNVPIRSWRAGVAVDREVDAYGRVTKVTRSGTDGSTQVLEQRAYNAQGRVQTATNARGATTTYGYDAQGNRTNRTNAAGQTTYYGNFDAHGRPRLITKPNGTSTAKVFDTMGRLTQLTVAGLTKSFAYDAAGRLVVARMPDGSYVYRYFDSAGFLYAVSNHRGEAMFLERDVDGKVTSRKVYAANNTVVNAEYVGYDNLGRVKTQTDSRGYSSTAIYSPDGRAAGLIDQLGRTTSMQLNLLNRVTGTFKSNTATGIQKTGAPTVAAFINYEPNKGTVQSVADTAAVGTGFALDALNRRVVEAGKDAGTRLRSMNAAGDVTAFTDARGVTYNLTRDVLGRITQVAGPSGAAVNYAYVPGRSDSLAASMNDPSGSTSWSYDPAGRITSKTQVTGAGSRSMSLWRDSLGRVTNMTYPSGMQVGVTYNGNEVSALVVNGSTFMSNITYRPMSGASTGWNWRNGGQRHYREYDNSGRTLRTSLGERERWVGYDATGRINITQDANLSGSVSSTSYYSYDAAGQLSSYSVPTGSGVYGYDSNGNRLVQSNNGYTQNLSYAADSNRLLTGPRGAYSYAADGNITSDGQWSYGYDEFGRLKTIYGYDGEQEELTRSYNGQGTRNRLVRRFWYDPSGFASTGTAGATAATSTTVATAAPTGLSATSKAAAQAARSAPTTAANTVSSMTGAATSQPVQRSSAIASPARSGLAVTAAAQATTPVGTKALASTNLAAGGGNPRWIMTDDTHYFHADNGQLIGEYNRLTGYSAETIWFNGMPVGAMINGVLYNVHSDHLGTPRSLTRTSDNLEVWRWDGEPFGNSFPTNPAGIAVTYNLRFAGQQYEAYTGFHQNWFRDYDPYTGRYIQADPIGLEGGWNRYGYVGGDPLSWIDPTGLDWFRDPRSTAPYTVGREGHPLVPPGGIISRAIENYCPAGRTFGAIHDARVDDLVARGVPDWRANIPTMPGAYLDAFRQESINSLQQLDQNIRNLYRR